MLVPWGAESALCGQLDIIDERALRVCANAPGLTVEAILEDWGNAVAEARRDLIQALASLDDESAGLWIEAMPVSAAVRRQTIAGRFVPVIGGSAYRHIGAQSLVDAIVDFLPAPAEVPRVQAIKAPLAALAFKIVRHPQAGRLVYVRVYKGVLEKGTPLLNPRLGKTERSGRLLRVFADRRD